jgi:hypothetical protein
MAAVAAALDVTAECCGAATLDRGHGTPPRGRQRRAVPVKKGLAGVAVYVRPHDIALRPAADGPGIIRHIHIAGPLARLIVAVGQVSIDVAVAVEDAAALALNRGDRVAISARVGTVFPHPTARCAALLPMTPTLSLAFRRATR